MLHRVRKVLPSTSSLYHYRPVPPSLRHNATAEANQTRRQSKPSPSSKSGDRLDVMEPDPENRARFIKAMEVVYGPFDKLSLQETSNWSPPSEPGAGGHLGRYLWTDAFGVINFVTLYKETSSERYLNLAKRLVTTVHDILGSRRDGLARLEGATDEEPLKGGLRIGKMAAAGIDGDGQYHHYLTLWMFALNRLSIASGQRSYNDLAIQLAEAVHPRFVTRTMMGHARLVWKISVDMRTVMVPSEGHLDAATGFAMYKVLRDTAHRQKKGKEKGQDRTLFPEIQDYAAITARSRFFTPSSDPLDLGMGLWVSQFCDDEDGASWADEYRADALLQAAEVVPQLIMLGEDPASGRMRLAFREFGLCLGVGCAEADERLKMWIGELLEFWRRSFSDQQEEGDEGQGQGQGQGQGEDDDEEALKPISRVMYAAALIPGAFRRGYLETW